MLHDGQRKHGTHHVGLFASCIRKIKTIIEGKVDHKEKNVIILLECSLLGADNEEGEFHADKFHACHAFEVTIT